MVLKKNLIGYLKLSLLLLFMLFLVSSFTVCNAADSDYYQLTDLQMQVIVDYLGATSVSGEMISAFTDTYNTWARTMAARAGFSWIDYDVIFIYGNSSGIYWVLNNSTVTASNGPDLYFQFINYNTTTTNMYGFSDWNRDNANNITGYLGKTVIRYNIVSSSPNMVNSSSMTQPGSGIPFCNSGGHIDITRNSVGSYDVYVSSPRYVVFEPYYTKQYFTEVAGRNADGLGYQYFRLTNTLSSGDTPPPTPTPTPTATPTGGGGSTDLSTTNTLIENVSSTIESGDKAILDTLTEPADFSGEVIYSGDIIDSIGFELMQDPYDNFWLFFVTNLRTALLESVRVYEIDFLGNTYYIDLDEIGFPVDSRVKATLRLFSVLVACWAILKLFKTSADLVQSANMDRLLELNEEEGFIDFF